MEEEIRRRGLRGEDKRLHRLSHAKPHVERFFTWVDEQRAAQGLLPSNRMTKALNYAHVRREALQVFLSDPDVAPDTNHLERALRVIPMAQLAVLLDRARRRDRRHRAKLDRHVQAARPDIDPATYLIDVLQRISQHPAARVAELTPRLWKLHFAANPLLSDLHKAGK